MTQTNDEAKDPQVVDIIREDIIRHLEAVYGSYSPSAAEFLDALSGAYAFWEMRFQDAGGDQAERLLAETQPTAKETDDDDIPF